MITEDDGGFGLFTRFKHLNLHIFAFKSFSDQAQVCLYVLGKPLPRTLYHNLRGRLYNRPSGGIFNSYL